MTTLNHLAPIRCFLLFTLCLPSAGQGHSTHVDPWNRIAWDKTGTTETFTQSAAGVLVPGIGKCVLLQWGQDLDMVYAPGTHQTILPVGTGFSSFCVLPGAAPSGLDAIAAATSNGLIRIHYDETLPGNFDATFLSGTVPYANAIHLASGDWNADGLPDLVGVLADGLTVRTMTNDGQGGFTLGATFALQSPIRDLDSLEWSSQTQHTGDELALLTDVSLRVFKWDGTPIAGRLIPFPGPVMAVVKGSGSLDKVAVVQRDSTDPNNHGCELVLHSRSGSESAVTLVDVQSPVGLDAGDLDDDGDDDVALSYQSEHRVRVYENLEEQSLPTTFDGSHSSISTGDPSIAAPSNQAVPCLEDFDNDGWSEMVIGVHDPEWVRVYGKQELEDSSTCPPVFANYYGIYYGGDLDTLYSGTAEANEIGVEFEVSNVWNGLTTGMDYHLRVVVWRQPNDTTGTVLPAAVRDMLFEIPDGSPFFGATDNLRFGFTFDEDSYRPNLVEFADKYFFEITPVRYSSPGTPYGAKKTHVGSMTGILIGSTSPSYQHLIDTFGAYSNCPLTIDAKENANDPPPDGGYLGGSIPQRRVPKLPPGQVPILPLKTVSVAKPASTS